jgi:hypothetical protein
METLNADLSATMESFFISSTPSTSFYPISVLANSTKKYPKFRRFSSELEIKEDDFVPVPFVPSPKQPPFTKSMGEQWYEHALLRLKVVTIEEEIKKLQSHGILIRDELEIKKSQVKNELKQYDLDFQQIYGCRPNHEEKEPMRPLYHFYKRIKRVLEGAANSRKKAPTVDPEEHLRQLLQEKRNLKQNLENYRIQFEAENHGKSIKHAKDMAPVAEIYERYKQLKLEISCLQETLQQQSSSALEY